MGYPTWIRGFAISSRNRSAGRSRTSKTPPRFVIAPEARIGMTIDAGNAVVPILALISVLASQWSTKVKAATRLLRRPPSGPRTPGEDTDACTSSPLMQTSRRRSPATSIGQ
jgi:hypothetical protein